MDKYHAEKSDKNYFKNRVGKKKYAHNWRALLSDFVQT